MGYTQVDKQEERVPARLGGLMEQPLPGGLPWEGGKEALRLCWDSILTGQPARGTEDHTCPARFPLNGDEVRARRQEGR